MTSTLTTPRVNEVLKRLYADAASQRALFADRPRPSASATPFERYSAIKEFYMPIDRPFGNLLYSLIRSSRPACLVEFGTSFGVSTIFLASAVADNNCGRIITTEFIPEKAETAQSNLAEAGLDGSIEFRLGDALQTLASELPAPVDFLFLDGDKAMYVDIVRLLEPRMSSGCLVLSDNTDHEGAQAYLDHVRHPDSAYISTPLLTTGGDKAQSGHELSLRL